MMRRFVELAWNGSPPVQAGVRAIKLVSPFYHLHMLCDELNAGALQKFIVDDDPSHIVVAKRYWHQLLSRLPCAGELWLYPSTAAVLYSACAPPTATERVLPLPHKGIHRRRPSAPKPASLTTATESGQSETSSAVEGDVPLSEPHTLLSSPLSKSSLIAAKRKVVKREGSHDLDITPGLWHSFASRQLLDLEESTWGIVRWRSVRLHHSVPWRRYGRTTTGFVGEISV